MPLPLRREPFGIMLRLMDMRLYRPGLASTVLGASLCAGCLASPHSVVAANASHGPAECLPAALVVVPSTLPAGGRVRLTAPAANCDLQYGQGKTYTVTLGLAGRAEPKSLGRVPVQADGSFATTLTIPADATPGDAFLEVAGSPFDQCAASSGASCAGYVSPRLTLTSGSSPQPQAQSICEHALHGPVAAASSSTVGEVRDFEVGGPATLTPDPSRHPARNAFLSASRSDYAAWCTVVSGKTLTFYGAAPNAGTVKLETVNGYSGAVPDHPLAIP